MSLPRETVLDVMALADGELDDVARSRAERLVSTDEEARRLFEAMRRSSVGPELKRALDEAARAGARGPVSVADAVMDRLGASRRLAPAPRRRIGDRRGGDPRGARSLAAVTCAILAAAAGAAVVWRMAAPRPDAAARVIGGPPAVVEPVASLGDLQGSPAVPAGGVEVHRVDSGSRPVSLYRIAVTDVAPAGGSFGVGQASAPGPAPSVSASRLVIWIDDDAVAH